MILLVVCTPVLMRAPRNLFLSLVLYLYLLPLFFSCISLSNPCLDLGGFDTQETTHPLHQFFQSQLSRCKSCFHTQWDHIQFDQFSFRCAARLPRLNNAIDPFLFKIHNSLRAKSAGIVRACADDIGITLSMLRHLRMIHPIFQDC